MEMSEEKKVEEMKGVEETQMDPRRFSFGAGNKTARSPTAIAAASPILKQPTLKASFLKSTASSATQEKTPAKSQEKGLCKLTDCVSHALKMHEFTKEHTTTHRDLKDMVVRMMTLLEEALKEKQTLSERVAKVEKELKEMSQAKAPKSEWPALKFVDRPIAAAKKRSASPKETPTGPKKRMNGTPATEGRAEARKGKEMEWKKVERKKNIRKEKARTKGVRQKADALIVGVTDPSSYADVLRKVKSEPTLKELGENVARIRRTKNGELLFEMKRDPSVKSSLFKDLVKKTLGEAATVRALSQEVVVECRNLDEITTEEELREALKTQLELDDAADAAKIRLRKAYGGSQIAEIKLLAEAANKLLKAGKVKVGWTVCSLRAVERLERCFKCMGFGHQAKHCQGEDRSKMCRKCG